MLKKQKKTSLFLIIELIWPDRKGAKYKKTGKLGKSL